MNRWRLIFAGILLASLCACAPQQGGITPAERPAVETPSIPLAKLPCAEIISTDAVTVRYPTEAIYRNGAVLPKTEGLACLQGLADWLKSLPQNRWQVTVAGEAGYGFDPLALAGKRQELLQRFFTRKGVRLEDWQWHVVAGQSEQLQLLQITDSL